MSKVLVVEDNDLNLKLFHDLLSLRGYEVIISRDGIGIPEIIALEEPDLLLMDIQLGSISGIDIIKHLKATESTKHIPIIAITAFAMKQDEIKIIQSGCDMYISKPVSIDRFFHAVEQYLPICKDLCSS